MRGILFIAMTGLIGCAPFPELDSTMDAAARNAPFPKLINLDQLTRQTQTTTPTEATNLDARLANLKARADALRGPVIEDTTSTRLANGMR